MKGVFGIYCSFLDRIDGDIVNAAGGYYFSKMMGIITLGLPRKILYGNYAPSLKISGESLKVVATYSVGYEHLNIGDLKSAGVRIGHTPDVLTEATAEMAVAILLAVSRHVVRGAVIVQQYVIF